MQFIGGTSGLTVKHCRFENVNLGVNDNWAGLRLHYRGQSFIGRDDPKHLSGWTTTSSGSGSMAWTGRYSPSR